MADWWTSLEATRAEVWRRIARGVADRHAPARHPVLATKGLGEFAEARVLVLRGADPAGVLELHTDTETAKIKELTAHPGATLLIWEAEARLQIRLRVRITVTMGAETEAKWAQVPDSAREVYGGTPLPGAPIPSPEAFSPAPDPTRFAVLTCEIAEIETLHLGPDRHRRAVFAEGQARWIAP